MLPNSSCPDVFSTNGPNVLSQVKVRSKPNSSSRSAARLAVPGRGTGLLLTLYRRIGKREKLVHVYVCWCAADGRLHHPSPEGRNVLLCMPGAQSLVRDMVRTWAMQLSQMERHSQLQPAGQICCGDHEHHDTLHWGSSCHHHAFCMWDLALKPKAPLSHLFTVNLSQTSRVQCYNSLRHTQ